MRMKQFEGHNMREALAKVKTELGANAVILSTTEIPSLDRAASGQKRVKVTAAIDEKEERFGKAYLSPQVQVGKAPQRLDRALSREALYQATTPREAAARQAVRTAASGGPWQELIESIQVQPPPWRSRGPRAVIVVGPSGVGKTVTAAKIAAQARFQHGCNAGLLCADTIRIGGVEQLASYARILDMPFTAIPENREIGGALRQLRGCSLVVVDTAGVNPRSEEDIGNAMKLTHAVQSRMSCETYLVVAASQSEDDQRASCAAFTKHSCIDGLIFTKIDEAQRPSSVVSTAVSAKLAVSFVAAGKQVLSDLIPAQPESIARLANYRAA